ncbi:MAG: 30S ribosomal protein S8 [bacterium]|nr:30S ribosomal protein S8 [bacterium]
MMTDPIADMLTRIRNAQAVRKTEVLTPYSKLRHAIADVLVSAGKLAKAEKVEEAVRPTLRLELKYAASHEPAIRAIRRVSTPGRRVYTTAGAFKTRLTGYAIAIISTSQGIMTDAQARRAGVGGEVICEVD